MKINILVSGEKYLGELLIVDYGMNVKEDSWYVVLNNGEIERLEKEWESKIIDI